VKRACEVVVDLAISGVEEKLAIRKMSFSSMGYWLGEEDKHSRRSGHLSGIPHLSNVTYPTSCEGRREYIFVYACLGYVYT
jgi:hypothetical protein